VSNAPSVIQNEVLLQIPEEEKLRLIGRLGFSRGKKIYLSYRKPEHFFRKYGGYGFNLEIVNKLLDYWFVIKTDLFLYYIHRDILVEKGIVVQYAKFERQIVLPIGHFNVKELYDNKKNIV